MSDLKSHKVVHISKSYPRNNKRILFQECRSLAQAGFDVHLLVADGKGAQDAGGMHIHDNVNPSVFSLFQTARKMDAQLYHCHGADTILIAILLRIFRKTVMLDFHEDLEMKAKIDESASDLMKKVMPSLIGFSTKLGSLIANYTVVSRAYLSARMPGKSIVARNYPFQAEAPQTPKPWAERYYDFIYVGKISKRNGLIHIIDLLRLINEKKPVRAVLIGEKSPDAELYLAENPLPENITIHPPLKRKDLLAHLQSSKIALHLPEFHFDLISDEPEIIYDYMLQGLPMILSDFSKLEKMTEPSRIGYPVKTDDYDAMVELALELLNNEARQIQKGQNSTEYTLTKHVWEKDGKMLVALYKHLLGIEQKPK